MENPAVSRERAIKESSKVLNDLGITELEMYSCSKAVWMPDFTEWDEMEVDWSSTKAGYTILYYRIAGGLAGYQQSAGSVFESLPKTVYAPPFYQEILKITVTDDGVQEFVWENMAQVEKVIAQNTNLLSFEIVKERLADHMLYGAVAGDEANGIDNSVLSNRYVITKVQLRTTYSDAYNAPNHAWLVPVWVFEMDWWLTVRGEESFRGSETVMIHAIDGGYIAPGREVSG